MSGRKAHLVGLITVVGFLTYSMPTYAEDNHSSSANQSQGSSSRSQSDNQTNSTVDSSGFKDFKSAINSSLNSTIILQSNLAEPFAANDSEFRVKLVKSKVQVLDLSTKALKELTESIANNESCQSPSAKAFTNLMANGFKKLAEGVTNKQIKREFIQNLIVSALGYINSLKLKASEQNKSDPFNGKSALYVSSLYELAKGFDITDYQINVTLRKSLNKSIEALKLDGIDASAILDINKANEAETLCSLNTSPTPPTTSSSPSPPATPQKDEPARSKEEPKAKKEKSEEDKEVEQLLGKLKEEIAKKGEEKQQPELPLDLLKEPEEKKKDEKGGNSGGGSGGGSEGGGQPSGGGSGQGGGGEKGNEPKPQPSDEPEETPQQQPQKRPSPLGDEDGDFGDSDSEKDSDEDSSDLGGSGGFEDLLNQQEEEPTPPKEPEDSDNEPELDPNAVPEQPQPEPIVQPGVKPVEGPLADGLYKLANPGQLVPRTMPSMLKNRLRK